MALFSIIVPVYNVEKYLNECIDSILVQDYVDYDVILVDDGSTDMCPQICDFYAQKDDRVQVFHKKNGGLSDARNVGIDNAIGQYVLFVDSDDKIEYGALSSIAKTIKENNEPDVIFLEAIKFYSNGRIEPMGDGYQGQNINGKSHIDVLRFISTMPKYPGSACTKAIKRELLTKDLKFVVGLISEDIEWTYRLFQSAKSYAYCSSQYYWYRKNREGSITFSVSEKKIESMLWTVEKWATKEPKNQIDEIINSFVAYQYLVMILNIAKLKDKKRFYIKKAKKFKWILSYGQNFKCKLTFYCTKILGLNLTSCLLKIYKR